MPHSSSLILSRRRVLSGLLACGSGWLRAGDGGTSPVRILFFGNSYMANHGVPAIVWEMLLSTRLFSPHIASYLQNGYRLDQHAADAAGLKLLKDGADDGKPWDVLVVQEQSTLSAQAGADIKAQQAMSDALTRLATQALAVNPRMLIVVFQVWPRHPKLWDQGDKAALSTGPNATVAQARIHHANAQAVRDVLIKHPDAAILVSPVGDFWRLVQDIYPALLLYDKDGTHPEMLGSILAALVLTGSIVGREAVEKSTWIGDCPFSQVERIKKALLDHPEVFKAAGR